MTQYARYIDAVLTGKETACEYVRKAVERHVSDLETATDFVFSEKEADKAIAFCQLCRHTSGGLGGEKFNLQDNQAFILAMLFGWRRKDNGKRRFTQAYLEMARKAGKSELAAVIQLYTGFFEGDEGAQVYTAATTREQANMVFRAVKKMARYLKRDSPALSKKIDILANSVVYHPTDSFIQKVSADAGTLDGLNPHNATVDEYHAHKDDSVKGVMQTGMGSLDNPLLLIITTAGFDKDAPCYKVERANAVAVLSGERKQENLFALIFTLDEGDDWQDESVWRKANPNLGSTPTLQYLREQVQDAINKGASTRVQVLTKNFNIWTDAPTIWIPEEEIKAVMRPIDYAEFIGRPVFQGCDIGARRDMTARALFSPPFAGKPALLKVDYWVPQAAIGKREKDVAGYRYWTEDGFLKVTPGDIFDFEFVKKEIISAHSDLGAQKTRFDPWNSYQMMVELLEQGIDVGDCRPDYRNLNEPCKWIDQAIGGKLIEIDSNPVLLWNFRNVVLDRNADDSMKPNKKRSGEKIDGISATLAAVFGWLTNEEEPLPYWLRDDQKIMTV